MNSGRFWWRDLNRQRRAYGTHLNQGTPCETARSRNRGEAFASLAYRYGEYFYNFQGLRLYKDKFDPEWRPSYLVCSGGRAVPGVLADLAALISGGLLGAIRK